MMRNEKRGLVPKGIVGSIADGLADEVLLTAKDQTVFILRGTRKIS